MRYIYKLLAALTCFILVLFGASTLYSYYQETPDADIQLPPLSIVLPETRLLVIAPHSDDETLGCGGIIRDVLAAGGQVMVVVMTNGDGFTFAVEEQFHRPAINSTDYIQLGYVRQSETLRALRRLGLSDDKVVFFCFPDRGLNALWTDNWDIRQPYLSKYTASNHSPYNSSYQQAVPYAGQAVLANLGQVMSNFKPTLILAPHPADEHSDHAATWTFVAASFIGLSDKEISPKPELYTYLVHSGSFPIPHGYRRGQVLLPPRPLLQSYNSQWMTYEIDANAESIKEQAIKEYASQLRVPIMSSLLHSFIRKNELFAKVDIPLINHEQSTVDLASLATWNNQEPILVSSRGVKLLDVLEPRAKIVNVSAVSQHKNIWLRFHIPDFLSNKMWYNVSVVTFRIQPIERQREKQDFYFSAVDTNLPLDNIIRFQDDVIIKLPHSPQGSPDYFFIRVLTKDRFGVVRRHTVWQPVRIRHSNLSG
ncbi:MAG: PIG-L deacetylase family protein [Sporomusa sp.]